ncbi:hypothetical protein [Pedobacter sp. SL55]|uniref:hypothetical protein n=1 Tax=Pedobacter sp. SL55 TaxID=2995161 RepID=UPI00226FF117|nr:hypothetical protein [Pedobacter sp. SL55]WAC40563.1 hypothetical protein OVA16_18660 [Pedobacter sp. SL55]
MKKLTKSQAEQIEAWLNKWEQLKGSAIPLRFREQFGIKPKVVSVFSKITLSNGVVAEVLRIDGGVMRKATERCKGDNTTMFFVIMEYVVRVDGKLLGANGVDNLDVSDIAALTEIVNAQMISPCSQ